MNDQINNHDYQDDNTNIKPNYKNFQDTNNKSYFANKYNIDLDSSQTNYNNNNLERDYAKNKSQDFGLNEKTGTPNKHIADREQKSSKIKFSSDLKDEKYQAYNFEKFDHLEDNRNRNIDNNNSNVNSRSYLDNKYDNFQQNNNNSDCNNFTEKYKSFNDENTNLERKYNFESNLKSNDYKEKELKKDNDLNSYNDNRIGSSIGNTTAVEERHPSLNLNSNRINSALDNKKEFENKNAYENKKDENSLLYKKFSSEKRSFRYENDKGSLSRQNF